ncbi:MAG: methyltransferase domain-containing protein [Planctomycetes bacterium]|nr:methyltransferase domain-containing protein [Planctomycetota bacterium]
MTAALGPARARPRFHGALQILRYNWPLYALGALACAAGLALALSASLPATVRALLALAAACAAGWAIASLAAAHHVYDRSGLRQWDWLRAKLSRSPRSWANLHAGLDETTGHLERLFPGSHGKAIDFYDPVEMRSGSIARARRSAGPAAPAERASAGSLPLRDAELDAAFLIFAAHELRSPEARLRFFREVHRTLAPGGELVLVEHLRDAASFAAFGPGFLHFLPRREWVRLAREAGFRIRQESAFTAFVRVFVLSPSSWP